MTVSSRFVLVGGWLALLGYGCTAEPADDGDNGLGGSAGTGVGGVAGSAAGSAGSSMSGAAGSGVSGAGVTGGAGPSGGTAGAPGGAGPSGGTAGMPAGGTAGDSAGSAGTGTAGTGTAGSGTAGSAGTGANMDPMCKSISNNAACTAAVGDGKMCLMMPCGLGDSGRRDCNCATNWTCSSCNFSSSPIMTKPATADTPCSGVVNGMPCATGVDSPESVCNNSANTPDDPYCMCASDPRNPANPPEWNCDSAPSSW